MALAVQRFREVFGEDPTVHGAAGWQMNAHAYRRTQSLGFRYASDTRGTHPFIPVIRAEIVGCPQFPTTLPTLDELIGLDGVTAANVADALLERTARDIQDHIYTLHAELEGMKLAPAFDKLLAGWKAQGYELVAMRDLVSQELPAKLPLHSVIEAPVAGRSGTLAAQGPAFLAT
jgi:peptidoglycan/xylan/chitin deacetylase (PgdA/CDA1 family)